MIRLSYGRLFQDRLDGEHGLRRERLAELAARFREVQAEVRRRREAGEYGFYALADQAETVAQIKGFAEGLGQAHDHVLVLGIGGSALGTKALLTALRRPGWNEWDDEGATSSRGSRSSRTWTRPRCAPRSTASTRDGCS